jgi:hypothetical protein
MAAVLGASAAANGALAAPLTLGAGGARLVCLEARS